jgi:hypothetical protein
MIVDTLWLLAIGAIALLLVSAAIAPLESLGWWAGWYGQQADDRLRREAPELLAGKHAVDAGHFLVYLSGIGVPAGDQQLAVEVPFIAALQAHLPGTVVSSDVFPYSVTNLGLSGERVFGRLWQFIASMRARNPDTLLAWLVNARNMLQVAVSADNRYGPLYNVGVAREVLASLLRNGYRLRSGVPITLFGYSGGGQIALGIAPYLKKVVQAPIRVISLGGVMSSDPGLQAIDQLFHLDGDRDTTDDLGAWLFPGRWRLAPGSPWNQALAQGKITVRKIGPMAHTGPGGYLDQHALLPDGRSHFEVTLSEVLRLIAETKLDKPLPLAIPPRSGDAGAGEGLRPQLG